jgi:hypothetical protein
LDSFPTSFAYRLQERNPHLSFVILEGRHEIGGTWSLFQYPGIRSDSDLYTFGYLQSLRASSWGGVLIVLGSHGAPGKRSIRLLEETGSSIT